MRRVGGLALVCVAVAGCGKSQPATTVTVATTVVPAVTAPSTTNAAKPAPPAKPKPRARTAPPVRRTPPPKAAPGGEQTLVAITGNDEVLALGNGTVWWLESPRRWTPGEKITVGSSEDTLYDTALGESVPVMKLGAVTEANADAAEGEHTLEALSGDGSLIVLNDASVWAVAPADRRTAATWRAAAIIQVEEGSSGARYRLLNTDTQGSVEAGYIANK